MATKITRVEKEYILRSVIEARQPVYVNKSKLRADALLLSIEEGLLCLEQLSSETPLFSQWDHVSVLLDFRGTPVAFTSVVRRTDGNDFYLEDPETIYRGLTRRFVRIAPPRDLAVSFILQGDEYDLNYPQCEEYSEVELPKTDEVFKTTDIKNLIDSFRDKARSVSSENAIIMFRNRKPETFEERIIAKTGRTLYLPSTRTGLVVADPYSEGRLVTRAIEAEYEKGDPFPETGGFEAYLERKRKEEIHAEVYCPIVYYTYVVGYVYLANKGDRGVSFDMFIVDMAYDFSRVLAFFLKKNGYFQMKDGMEERHAHGAELIDISAGGMLFTFQKEDKIPPLRPKTQITVKLGFEGGELAIEGRVIRRTDEGNEGLYGVAFQELPQEELNSLYKYLYGKEFDNGETQWEGYFSEREKKAGAS
jgi:hypothetical protein